ncbi:MAG: sigma-70 family RNA polymerase sigma factor [Lachnospiraceae bacterium]|nr:sigma-70 family RNA polymerase sigma factor [Lachnospiraceae bacterium]
MTEKIAHQFDAYCKRVLQNEKIDYYRQKQYRMHHEVFLSDLEEGLLEKYLVTNDTYMLGDIFHVLGHEIKVYDECLAKVLHQLPEKKRTVILMSFYLGMSDAEIGRILGRAGSSIHTRRVSALSMLRKLMEERWHGAGQ